MNRRRRAGWMLAWGVAVGGCGSASPGTPGGPDGADAALDDAKTTTDAGSPDSGDPAPAGEVIDSVIDEFDTYRTQIADIVPLGDGQFVVGYRDATDRLKYARWDAAGRQGLLEFAAEGVMWVRADTSEGFLRPDFLCPNPGGAWVNTLAVQHGGDSASVRLDVHTNCDGRMTLMPVPIAEGVRPSAVTVVGSGATPTRTLVVYGRRSDLFGRFVRYPEFPVLTVEVGEEFPIARFSLGSAFSTDVIYNQHSNRFIVGFIQRGGLGCSVWNVVLDATVDPPAVVGAPAQFGKCDGDQGGHHTSVAYNPRGDGRYAWWRQDMNLVKSVFIHDAFGAATSPVGLPTANVLEFGNLWTAPVASTPSAETPYLAMFGKPYVHLFDMDAAGIWTDRSPRFGPTAQVAVRAFPSGVVGLVRVPPGTDFTTATLRLLRAPFPVAQSHMPSMRPSMRL